MRVRLKLRPGQPGTKKLVARYGSQLVCVRYRYDAQRKKRYKTVELIVDVVDWEPPPPSSQRLVLIRVAWNENALQAAVRAAGGRWRPDLKAWEIRYGQVAALGLTGRIFEPDV